MARIGANATFYRYYGVASRQKKEERKKEIKRERKKERTKENGMTNNKGTLECPSMCLLSI